MLANSRNLSFRIPSTIFGMPWHELKALHKEQTVDVPDNPKKKKQRKILLGRLSKDLDYLEGLLTEVKLAPGPGPLVEQETLIPTAETDNAVSKETENAITFLKERQEFWSQFKPMYCK